MRTSAEKSSISWRNSS